MIGANITQIATLLSKEFLLLVMVAIALATTLAWWAMNSWLQQFAYRTEFTLWIFAFAGSIKSGEKKSYQIRNQHLIPLELPSH